MKKYITILSLVIILIVVNSTNSIKCENESIVNSSNEEQVYGFVLSADGNQSFRLQENMFRAVNFLLEKNINVYWTREKNVFLSKNISDSDSAELNNFKKGSFIFPYTDNDSENLNITIAVYKNFLKYKDAAYKILEPISISKSFLLKEPRIGLYKSKVVTYSADWFMIELGFNNMQNVTHNDILNGNLSTEKYDLILMGGQAASDIETFKELFSPEWKICKNKIRSYLRSGGNYIGICHGSARSSHGVKRPLKVPMDYKYTRSFNSLGFYLKIVDCTIYRALPGSGYMDVEFTDMNHPITYGCPRIIKDHYYGKGPMFIKKFGSDTKQIGLIKDIQVDEWNIDSFMDDSFWYNSDVVPQTYKDKKINDWLDYSRGQAIWVEQEYGDGRAVVFGGHPEWSQGWNGSYFDTLFPRRVLGNTLLYLSSEPIEDISTDSYVTFSDMNCSISVPSYAKINQNNDPYEVRFNASVPNNEDYGHYWFCDYKYFKDSSALNILRKFNHSGKYNVGFCVMTNDSRICVKNTSIKVMGDIFINSELENNRVYYGYTNETISFSGDVINGFEPINYTWNFGEGNFSFEKDAEYIFEKPGFYEVTLSVDDDIDDMDKEYYYFLINDMEPSFTFNVSVKPKIIRSRDWTTGSIDINVSKPGTYNYMIYLKDQYMNHTYTGIQGSSFEYTFNEKFGYFCDLVIGLIDENGSSYYYHEYMNLNSEPRISYYNYVYELVSNQVFNFYFNVSDFDGDKFDIIIDYGNGYIDKNYETIVDDFNGDKFDIIVKYGNGHVDKNYETTVDKKEYDPDCEIIDFFCEYKYNRPGNYTIRVKAIDTNGYESDWVPILISNVKIPTLKDLFLNMLRNCNFINVFN